PDRLDPHRPGEAVVRLVAVVTHDQKMVLGNPQNAGLLHQIPALIERDDVAYEVGVVVERLLEERAVRLDLALLVQAALLEPLAWHHLELLLARALDRDRATRDLHFVAGKADHALDEVLRLVDRVTEDDHFAAFDLADPLAHDRRRERDLDAI